MAKAPLALEQLIEDTEQLIIERAKQADEARRPDPEVIAALANAGLMKLLVPQEYGGHEVHPAVLIEFTARIAQIDGSTAWVAMTCNEEAELVSAYLPPSTCRQIWNDNPEVVFRGVGGASRACCPGARWVAYYRSVEFRKRLHSSKQVGVKQRGEGELAN